MSTADVHRCYAAGCAVLVPRGRLMCSPHWALVPGKVQQSVWRAWRAFVVPQLRADPAVRDGYRNAIEAARDAVAARAKAQTEPVQVVMFPEGKR